MSAAVFPIVKFAAFEIGAEFRTLRTPFENGAEQRRAKWSSERRRYAIGNPVMPLAEAETLWNFYRARKGSFDNFYFKDVSSPAEFTVTNEAVAVAPGPPADTFALARPPIIPGSEDIFLDSGGGPVLQPESAYALDDDTGVFVMNAPPASGTVITASYEFYRVVRFEDDVLNFLEFSHRLFAADVVLVEDK